MLKDKVISEIKKLAKEKNVVTVAIDGRCGAGKTTLAADLESELDVFVIHMDDFFLRPEQRTEERLNSAGENVDYERFLEEVAPHLKSNTPFTYRPYNCKTGTFDDEVTVLPKKVIIVEGSYSCHPKMWDLYDLHVFVDVDYDEQIKRLTNRNPAMVDRFKTLWIPLEEKYFEAFGIKDKCEIK